MKWILLPIVDKFYNFTIFLWKQIYADKILAVTALENHSPKQLIYEIKS